jgi:FkbM family methyltransferase
MISRNGIVFNVANNLPWFQKHFKDGGWEQPTFNVITNFSDKEKIYLDIGSWIGPMAMYASKFYKKVYAIEPDPVARKQLQENLAANTICNVEVCPVAIGNKTASMEFGGNGDLGNSQSTLLVNDGKYIDRSDDKDWVSGNTIKVECMKFSHFVLAHNLNLADVALVKIDIEGGEKYATEDIANGLCYHLPPLYISLHWKFLTREDIIQSIEPLFRVYSRCSHKNVQVTQNDILDNNYSDLLFTA